MSKLEADLLLLDPPASAFRRIVFTPSHPRYISVEIRIQKAGLKKSPRARSFPPRRPRECLRESACSRSEVRGARGAEPMLLLLE